MKAKRAGFEIACLVGLAICGLLFGLRVGDSVSSTESPELACFHDVNSSSKRHVEFSHEVLSRSDFASTSSKETIGEESSQAADEDPEIGEEAKLWQGVVSALLTELSDYTKSGDVVHIKSTIDRFRELGYGQYGKRPAQHHLPSSSVVKRQILDSLAVLGYEGLDYVLDYIADDEIDVATEAKKILFQSLDTSAIDDYRRAEIVIAAAEELVEVDDVNRLYQEFSNMRHSVGIETFKQIWKSGTDAAKSELSRVIGAFTHGAVTEIEDVDAWLEYNGDRPEDDWFYAAIAPEENR